MPKPQHHVFVCTQSRDENHPRGSCAANGASKVFQQFVNALTVNQMQGKVALTQTGCLGPCQTGVNVLVYPEGVLYSQVGADDVERIVTQHLQNGDPVQEKFAPKEVW